MRYSGTGFLLNKVGVYFSSPTKLAEVRDDEVLSLIVVVHLYVFSPPPPPGAVADSPSPFSVGGAWLAGWLASNKYHVKSRGCA